MTPERPAASVSDGAQPIKAWRCPKCGKIDDVEWVGGTHADRTTAGLNGRCDGQPEGPFYLVHVDRYLDVMLAERARDPEYACGAAYCDDPSCVEHGPRRAE